MKKTISLTDSDEMLAFVNAQQNFSRSVGLLIRQAIMRYGEDVDMGKLLEEKAYAALASPDAPVAPQTIHSKPAASRTGFSSAAKSRPSQTYTIPEGY